MECKRWQPLVAWISTCVWLVFVLGTNIEVASAQEKTPAEILDWIRENQGEYDCDGESVIALRLDRTRGIDPGFVQEAVNDQDLKRLELMPHIRELTLANRYQITDASLPHVSSLKLLRKLNLSRTNVSGRDLDTLAQLPLLYDLNLNHCVAFGDEGAASLKNLKRLIKLSVNADSNRGMYLDGWAFQIRSELQSTKGVPSPNSSLNEYRSGISDIGLRHIAELKTLRSLSLSKTRITDNGLEALRQLDRLTNLDLSFTAITDSGLAAIGLLSKLRSLHLTATYITDNGMEYLGALQDLQELSISGTQVSAEGLRKLRGCTKLRRLDLLSTYMASEVSEVLQQFQGLENVDLKGTRVTYPGIVTLSKELSNLSLKQLLFSSDFGEGFRDFDNGRAKLQSLNLSRDTSHATVENHPIQDDDLNFLREQKILDDLVVLDLGGSQVSDLGMAYLSGLPKLQHLLLRDSKVTDAGLMHLRGSKELTYLPIRQTLITLDGIINLIVREQGRSLEDAMKVAGFADLHAQGPTRILDIHANRTTDADLGTIAKLQEVETLLLQDNPISDIGLSMLTQIKNLRQLWVSGRLITGAGLASLKRLRTLDTLWLTDTQATESDLMHLADLPALRILNISGMPLSENATNYIKALESLESLIVDSAAMYRINVQEIQARNPKLTIMFSQKRALAATRGHERFQRTLPQGYHRVLEMGCVRTSVIDDPLISIFGDAHFERADDLHFEVKKKFNIAHWKELATLKSISLFRTQVRTSDLDTLRYMPRLRALHMSESQIADEAFSEIEKLTSLEEISLGGYDTQIHDKVLEHIGKLANLKALDLNRTKVTDAGMAHLRSLEKLEKLSLREVFIDEGISNLSQLRNLRQLDLYHTMVTDESLEHLYKLPNVRELNIEGTLVSQEGVKLLQKRLSNVTVEYGIISEEARSVTRRVAKMRIPLRKNDLGEILMLDLRNFRELATVMPLLEKLSTLQDLRLDEVSAKSVMFFSDSGPFKLQQMSQLYVLQLSGCTIDADAVQHLQEMPKLRYLWLDGANFAAGFGVLNRLSALEGLSLDSTSVVDADFAQLTELTQLKVLYLNSTSISKAVLTQLEKLPKLELLSLRKTSISEEDLEAFRKSNPKCKLYLAP